MKLRFRFVILVIIFIAALLSINVFLMLTGSGDKNLLEGAQIWPRAIMNAKLRDGVGGVGIAERSGGNAAAVEPLQPQVKPTLSGRGMITAEEFRKNPSLKTGNPLIDDYGKNNLMAPGENGRAVLVPDEMARNVSAVMETFRINVLASDIVPLNRLVPDSRFPLCVGKTYPSDLPSVSIIIPFHNEWLSVLLRTLYSIVNRTPRHLLWEIVMVDDASTLGILKADLDNYLETHFPTGLIKIVRLKERAGLIKARMEGVRHASGEVIVIFDSHMEVNIQWLEPLVAQVLSDRTSVAMGILDYIEATTFKYEWKTFLTKYAFDWYLLFFETYFRPEQYGSTDTEPKRGTMMVGAAFAVDRKFFLELGGYDEGMNVWGGENLELSWRVWLCGGSLIHIPCSKLGHIARSQPYSFPGGRREIEVHNYKRAVELWMEDDHKSFVYDGFPEMKDMDGGDLTERRKIKDRLKCKNFTWYLDNIWPELAVFGRNSTAWGMVQNPRTDLCLDNHNFLFTYPAPLYVYKCHGKLNTQGFTLTKGGLLRSSLQCVVLKQDAPGVQLQLEDCIIGPKDKWSHPKPNEHIRHERTGMCLDLCQNNPCVQPCSSIITQKWTFTHYL